MIEGHDCSIFPPPMRNLPEADIPIPGATAYLSQAETHQILFMEFKQDVMVPEHSHGAQWATVLEGQIELVIDGVPRVFRKGDRYFIPEGVKHSAFIRAGYADINWFGTKDRYRAKT